MKENIMKGRGMKKLLSMVLTLALVFSLMSITSVNVQAMQITISVTISGASDNFVIDVEPSNTVGEVKGMIEDRKGYSAEKQVLKFAGKTLDDTRSLADYNIQKESTLYLTIVADAPKHTCTVTGDNKVTDAEALTITSGIIPGGSYYLSGDYTLTGAIRVEEDTTVNLCLNDKVLDLKEYQILVDENATLNIYDCGETLRHFDADENGLWIYTSDDTDNTVSGGYITGGKGKYDDGLYRTGGAICSGGMVNLYHVNLIGNHNPDCSGGAIDSIGELVITDSKLCGNVTGGDGGAILSSGKLTVSNSELCGNVAEADGGAIYSSGKLTIKDSQICGNVSEDSGGAIRVAADNAEIYDSQIKSNTAVSGGGIYNECSSEDQYHKLYLSETEISDNTATEIGGGIYSRVYEECLSEGTKITMADGSLKNIEDIAVGDAVRSFDHETGEYTANTVYYAYEGSDKDYALRLNFESGSTLDIVGCHDLFSKEGSKYVTVSKTNYKNYIGKHFYNVNTSDFDKLVSVEVSDRKVNYYSIYVGKTFNSIANGYLTLPDDSEANLNIFKFNGDLSADQIQLQKDIAAYGLFTAEESEYLDEDEFEMFNMKYFKLMTGKGLISKEKLLENLSELRGVSLMGVLADSDPTDGYDIGSIILDDNTVIKDNTVSDEDNNLFLSGLAKAYVADQASINVGITLEDGTGEFSYDVYSDDVGFFSDNSSYAVKKAGEGEPATYTYSLVDGYKVSKDEVANGSFTLSASGYSADATDGSLFVPEGTVITISPMADSGYEVNTVSWKKASDNGYTVIKNDDGYSFTMPDEEASVNVTFKAEKAGPSSSHKPSDPEVKPDPVFVDVNEDDYFYDAVLWAVSKGITTGTDDTHFSPMNVTTRAQMVTFLWRAAGSPEPESADCCFTDVKAGEYYYKAVEWGYENGYVKGISATEFAPDVTVTRGQCVAILARMNGVKDEDTGYTHSFTDVKATDYYNNAVAWAATNKITTGVTETEFAPDEDCLRGQIVTFIYRSFNK